jgi:hypothetical protein
MPDMARLNAEFEPVAWWWTRNQIGRDLREFYEVSKELPPKLLELVRKLDTVESDRSGSSTIVSNVIEGKYLSRDQMVHRRAHNAFERGEPSDKTNALRLQVIGAVMNRRKLIEVKKDRRRIRHTAASQLRPRH